MEINIYKFLRKIYNKILTHHYLFQRDGKDQCDQLNNGIEDYMWMTMMEETGPVCLRLVFNVLWPNENGPVCLIG
jgi:hypothetical protein